MNIGLVIYGELGTLSGGYYYDRRLVESLRARGDTVEILSLPYRSYAAHLVDNLHFRLPSQLDLVIEDELNHPSLIAANRAPGRPPVVALVHHLRSSEQRPTWQNHLYRQVERAYLRSVDGFIFNSQTTRAAVAELVGQPRLSVVAFPPTDRFGQPLADEEVAARAGQDSLRILFLGNVIPRKGLHTLIAAMASLKARATLEVVGGLGSDPAYAESLQMLAAGLGLSTRIRFHGALDHEPLAAMLRRAHVLCVPSSYEGFGIAYLEGMAFGLPAIGTRTGAAGEIITDGLNGFLVPSGDAPALAECLDRLAADRDLLRRLSLSAAARYRQQPAWEQTAGEIRDFLLDLKARPRAR